MQASSSSFKTLSEHWHREQRVNPFNNDLGGYKSKKQQKLTLGYSFKLRQRFFVATGTNIV